MKQKTLIILILLLSVSVFISCGGSATDGSETTANDDKPKSMVSSEPKTLEEAEKNWQANNGIGPIASFELSAEIDQAMADNGRAVYDAKCTACHKPDKQFIGPAPKGILDRRTPAWVMNMIMNPEEMIQKDPIAKQLLIKFNGAPMANQSLTEEEARSVLEYFRTL
jgi:mono/diheme cytochrome c family protein